MSESIIINGLKFRKFLSEVEIRDIVRKLALEIREDYLDKYPQFLVILKGSIFFSADLIREIGVPCEVQTIKCSSYHDSLVSSGSVIISDLDFEIHGKDIIIAEDIVDTGLTLDLLMKELQKAKPRSLKVVTFLNKNSVRKFELKIDYIGKEINSGFVIGYGLDMNEMGRELKDIYIIEDE